ncbi:queuosine precursor transporter [Aggregatilinea lenta]|uniref:queuosine precursor transporter n=1 Tax=Aggregatilinea lenta TaxID=913108 RepID=UPI000E5A8908|nr:queuosine precursor transporter [Aggregatilinea lenta]
MNENTNTRSYRYYDLIMALFVTVLLISNLLSSAKIIDLKMSLGPIALAFDAGTLVFPISYIFGDVLTEVYGYKRSRRVIWAGFGANVLLGLFVWIAAALPGEAEWQGYAGQGAYDAILGGISGLIVASLAAYFLGAFSNSYVLAKIKVWTGGRWLWMRTIGSTLVGEGVDTIVFTVIATLLGVFPPEIFVSLVVTNYILKVGLEALMTPLTYRIVNLLKLLEREDYYDRATDFNPFKLSV